MLDITCAVELPGDNEVVPGVVLGTPSERKCQMAKYRSHPADVTADRVGDAYERYYDMINGSELDAFSVTIDVLRQIAAGERGPVPRKRPRLIASR